MPFLIKAICRYTYSELVAPRKFHKKTSVFALASLRHKITVNSAVANPSVSTPPIHTNSLSGDLIWRPATLLSAVHKHTHCPQPYQQHTGSVDVQLSSSRLLLPHILCTVTTCNVRSVWQVFLNHSVYVCCTTICINNTWSSQLHHQFRSPSRYTWNWTGLS